MYHNDSRIVLTLDAGGTNFVFSAIQGNAEIVAPVTLPAHPNAIDDCLAAVLQGFTTVQRALPSPAAAISFAFPGPADYVNGIIGDLPNFPAFRGGVALGPFLQQAFGIPVFINNDGNLFAYGEALAGMLPEVNRLLAGSGSSKQYKNLLAVTLGTGFGGGVVIDRQLLLGDNGCGGDVWLSANKNNPALIAEEGVSIRAVKRTYQERSGNDEALTPKEIFDIAEGARPGNRQAAIESFESLGAVAGFTIAESLNIVDGLVVIGGGIAAAHKYILPAMVAEMNGVRSTIQGDVFPRLQMNAYNLEDEAHVAAVLKEESKLVRIPGTETTVAYHQHKKTGVTVSQLGASKAIALGAYAFALAQMDQK
ncbi:MAG: ROK family protein [Haliscomenobacter sp.]|nr:ROK family protein [Haliscomenobacter sp.]